MNDRFKFRFWDKKEKEYFTCGNIDHKSGIFRTYPYRTYDWCFEHKNIIAEQCTGLSDKNGKLIYEGDIVREISKKEPKWEEYVIKVEWKGCGFNLYSDEDYDFEVIGNIHKNPELLEEYNAD